MKNSKIPIGVMQEKATVYCTICGCSRTRKVEALVYTNTEEAKEEAIIEYKKKATKPYTCRVCKSIKRDVAKVVKNS